MNPFFSNSTNITDESFFTSTPTFINGQNVFVSQEKNRKILDSVHTSIIGNPQIPYNGSNSYNFCYGNCVKADKQFFPPSGVLFSFSTTFGQPNGHTPPSQPYQFNPLFFNPIEIPRGINTNTPPGTRKNGATPNDFGSLFQPLSGMIPGGLGGVNYQHLSQNPFFYQCQKYPLHKLQFHMDTGTSCTDLLKGNTQVPGSQGAPDIRNVCGLKHDQNILYQGQQKPSPPKTFLNEDPARAVCENMTCGVRQLIINKPTTPASGHVVDTQNENTPCSSKQQTNETSEKAEQTSFSCDGEDTERRTCARCKGKKLVKKKAKKQNHYDSSSDEDMPSTSSCKRKKKRRDVEHETSLSDTS